MTPLSYSALAIVAALLVPTVALSQTTTCGEEFGKWVCRTAPDRSSSAIGSYKFDSPIDSFNRAYENTRRMPEDRREVVAPPIDQRDLSDNIQAAQDEARQRDVAALLREGRCEEAKSRALIGDDIDLADKVVRICTPASR